MRSNEIRQVDFSNDSELTVTFLREIAAQLAEHNERETAHGRDSTRLLNNYLTLEAMPENWSKCESSKRIALRNVADIIGWKDYPPSR